MSAPRNRRPSPAFVVAMIALFVGLGGTAGAVATQAVPLAKRALSADNAKKLGGQTSAQIVAQASARGAQAALSQSPAGPRPAASGAGLVTTKSAAGQIPAGGAQSFTVSCDAGQKVLGGGFSSAQFVLGFDSYPSNDTTWTFFIGNLEEATVANVNVFATCLR